MSVSAEAVVKKEENQRRTGFLRRSHVVPVERERRCTDRRAVPGWCSLIEQVATEAPRRCAR